MFDGSELERKSRLKSQRFSRKAERRMKKVAKAGRELRIKIHNDMMNVDQSDKEALEEYRQKVTEAGRELGAKVLVNYFRMIQLCATYQLIRATPGDKKLKKKAMDKIMRELNKVTKELRKASS